MASSSAPLNAASIRSGKQPKKPSARADLKRKDFDYWSEEWDSQTCQDIDNLFPGFECLTPPPVEPKIIKSVEAAHTLTTPMPAAPTPAANTPLVPSDLVRAETQRSAKIYTISFGVLCADCSHDHQDRRRWRKRGEYYYAPHRSCLKCSNMPSGDQPCIYHVCQACHNSYIAGAKRYKRDRFHYTPVLLCDFCMRNNFN